MWFKNLVVYRFNRPFTLTTESLEEQLAAAAFVPCSAQDLSRSGWYPPLGGQNGSLVQAGNNCLLVDLCTEDKLLPAFVIKDMLGERVEAIEADQNRKVRKKERDQLREAIMLELLPRAFSRYQHTRGYLDLTAGRLLVDAGSARRADDFCSRLRQTLGSLPIEPAQPASAPEVMTAWLRQASSLPPGFEAGFEALLRDPGEEGGSITCRQQPLFSDEVAQHLEAGKQVSRMALEWREKISLMLSDDGILRRLKFSDRLREDAAEQGHEDAEALAAADFELMTAELRAFVDEWLQALGTPSDSDSSAGRTS